jgi:DNA-binding transcriptional MerR regulator
MPAATEMLRRYMTRSGLARLEGVSCAAVSKWEKSGAIVPDAITEGGVRLFTPATVAAFRTRRAARRRR